MSAQMTETSGAPTGKKPYLWLSSTVVLAALLLTALTLRPPLTAIGPLAHEILTDAEGGISATALGLLGSVPLAVFAMLSLFAPVLARRLRLPTFLAIAMSAALLGSGLRAIPGTSTLFAGTVVLAAGLCMGNVLLPTATRRYFPSRTGAVTGAYTALMSAGGGVGVVLARPLAEEHGLGWRAALAWMGAPAALAIVLWICARIATRQPDRGGSDGSTQQGLPVRTSEKGRLPVASVGLFFGAQASFFYLAASWLMPLLSEKLVDEAQATIGVGAFSFAGVLTCLVVPTLTLKYLGLRPMVLIISSIQMIGATALVYGTSCIAFFGATCLAVGVTAAFSLSFTLFGAFGTTPQATTRLSGRAQAIGYMVAAAFPLLVGVLHTATDSWLPAAWAMTFLALLTLGSGLIATDSSRESSQH